ncbi:MAG: hypothetical protein DME26_14770 [Verrucomicrobia bacterium]|nr:MAG: hypothetical protein DME26_14770 [Verrucomicrobiota bacterium]
MNQVAQALQIAVCGTASAYLRINLWLVEMLMNNLNQQVSYVGDVELQAGTMELKLDKPVVLIHPLPASAVHYEFDSVEDALAYKTENFWKLHSYVIFQFMEDRFWLVEANGPTP